MADMTPVQILRAAAAKVREMARGTTAAPWFIADCDLHPRWILGQPQPGSPYAEDVAKSYTDGGGDGLYVSDADWKWMAFAHPRWAEPIAALLEAAAGDIEAFAGTPHLDERMFLDQIDLAHAILDDGNGR